MSERSPERALLDRHPDVRAHVAVIPEFQAWKSALQAVEIDGETLFVVGGDQLKDIDQVVVMWTNQFRPDLFSKK